MEAAQDSEDEGELGELVLELSGRSGHDFLGLMTERLRRRLDCDAVFVGELTSPKRLQVHASASAEEWEFKSYQLDGALCAEVANATPTFWSKGVGQAFPEDPFVSRHGIDSFYGFPLLDGEREVLGVVAAMDRGELNPNGAHTLFLSCAFRASAELRSVIAYSEGALPRRELERRRRLEAMGKLASGLAHDLNNLLFGISLNLSVLAETGSDSGEYLDDALKACGLAQELVERTLEFGRGAAGRTEHVSVKHVVRSALDQAQPHAGEDVTLEMLVGDGLPDVVVSRSGLFQILFNLVINAIQAIEEAGRVEVDAREVEFTRTEAGKLEIVPGRYVEICVADTGRGIAQENIEEIFEPFFSTGGKKRNSGLGLGIVNETVRGHGGVIEVDSTLGEGTTFTLVLPAAEGTERRAR